MENALQENIVVVENWCKMNNMKLNPNKSKCMLIGTSKKLKQQSSFNIYTNETILENVDAHKLMGIYINKNLKWNVHISYIYNKMMSLIHLLKRLTLMVTLRYSSLMNLNGCRLIID